MAAYQRTSWNKNYPVSDDHEAAADRFQAALPSYSS
jgi:hypothetical protein